jgi:hypothetical protein
MVSSNNEEEVVDPSMEEMVEINSYKNVTTFAGLIVAFSTSSSSFWQDDFLPEEYQRVYQMDESSQIWYGYVNEHREAFITLPCIGSNAESGYRVSVLMEEKSYLADIPALTNSVIASLDFFRMRPATFEEICKIMKTIHLGKAKFAKLPYEFSHSSHSFYEIDPLKFLSIEDRERVLHLSRENLINH